MSKTDFNGEVDRFKIGAGEGRGGKMMPEKIGRCILAPVLFLFLKWQIGTQGVDGMEEMS